MESLRTCLVLHFYNSMNFYLKNFFVYYIVEIIWRQKGLGLNQGLNIDMHFRK